MELKMVCEKCGTPAKIDEKKSNKNWKVYSTKCEKCGGKVTTKFE